MTTQPRAKTAIKAHIKTAIENRTGAPLGGRAATANLHTCGAWTLLGYDADVLAWQARVDPTPLTTHGELAALLAGRPTYDLTQTGPRLQLDHRAPDHIAGRPPGHHATTGPFDVVPAHRCQERLDGNDVTGTTLRAPPRAVPVRGDDPVPF